ncbi:hypothetical protein JAAARDRAFT_192129 [Jaapia argillacea MUCL 33604]|uniref:Uncharacterized protein n=1 Tax=Jaapia argillacea MUCL 33604 TaxID=933084 RepID=A0A067PY47_9AGAM|nr:hypothetical protein JAAARDRAFT_192129 [Jaapia argillacea MUCL 33604]
MGTNSQLLIPNTFIEPASAALRAIARHKMHRDGLHSKLHCQGGLHHDCALLQQESKVGIGGQVDYAAAMFTDILDAITALDREDGGFSVLIRVPGKLAPENKPPSSQEISIETYLPPHEVETHSTDYKGAISMIISIFGENIAIPHLTRLKKRCERSGVMPTYIPGKGSGGSKGVAVGDQGTYTLPSPVSVGSAHFRFEGVEFQSWKRFINADEHGDFSWMADPRIRQAVAELELLNIQMNKFQGGNKQLEGRPIAFVGPSSHAKKPNKAPRGTNELQASNHPSTKPTLSTVISASNDTDDKPLFALQSQSRPGASPPTNATSESTTTAEAPNARTSTGNTPHIVTSTSAAVCSGPPLLSSAPLVSLGPVTDALIDAFSLDNSVVGHLHHLVSTIRTTRWSHTLETRLGLTVDQATALAQAMSHDLADAPPSSQKSTSTNQPLWLIFLLLLAHFVLFFLPPLDEMASSYIQ